MEPPKMKEQIDDAIRHFLTVSKTRTGYKEGADDALKYAQAVKTLLEARKLTENNQ